MENRLRRLIRWEIRRKANKNGSKPTKNNSVKVGNILEGNTMPKKLKPTNVGSIGVGRVKLKAELQNDIRIYRKYRELQSLGFKCKAKIRMVDLQVKQNDINDIGVKLGIKRIDFLKDLKKYLKNL